jgi:hypothetical protein
MPPIFGILNTLLKQPEPEMISRIEGAAKYMKKRRVERHNGNGGYLAVAVSGDQMEVSSAEYFYEKGDFIIAADACIYRKEKGIGGERASERAAARERSTPGEMQGLFWRRG